jgi:hypothetical protein
LLNRGAFGGGGVGFPRAPRLLPNSEPGRIVIQEYPSCSVSWFRPVQACQQLHWTQTIDQGGNPPMLSISENSWLSP